jgi:hypothetical protein
MWVSFVCLNLKSYNKLKAPLIECYVCFCLKLLIRFLDLHGPLIILLPSLCVDKHVKALTCIVDGEILLLVKFYVMIIFVVIHDFFIFLLIVFFVFNSLFMVVVFILL